MTSRPGEFDRAPTPRSGWVEEMVAQGLQALRATQDVPGFPMLEDGRAKATFASPDEGTSSDIAVSVLALPPGFVNPAHSHEPEELLIGLHGAGKVIVDDDTGLDMSEGSVILIPPGASHSVVASLDGPLVLLAVVVRTGQKKGTTSS